MFDAERYTCNLYRHTPPAHPHRYIHHRDCRGHLPCDDRGGGGGDGGDGGGCR